MRVPSVGLPLDERRIVREGYALAEKMMAGYQDPPSPLASIINASRRVGGQMLDGLQRAFVRY